MIRREGEGVFQSIAFDRKNEYAMPVDLVFALAAMPVGKTSMPCHARVVDDFSLAEWVDAQKVYVDAFRFFRVNLGIFYPSTFIIYTGRFVFLAYQSILLY